MTVASSGSAIERLAVLEARVREADARVVELEAERSKSRRSVERAMGPLREYYEAVATGDREPDAGVEAGLRGAVSDAQATVELRPSRPHGRVIGFEAVDVRVESLLAGARRAAESAREQLSAFAAAHFEEMAAERLPRSRRVGEHYRAAAVALARADSRRAAEGRWWRHVCGLADVPHDLRRAPFETPGPEAVAALEARRFVPGVVPAPRYLLDDDGEVVQGGS